MRQKLAAEQASEADVGTIKPHTISAQRGFDEFRGSTVSGGVTDKGVERRDRVSAVGRHGRCRSERGQRVER
jgi:hypothetical protein